ncbi:hypothetical protein JKF63_03237 [Porcisia hertigi]|uniref:Stress-response A/B barrel domain-containing protein n=1 Tax=Porcisia hertigi TaxID=2761500 RepID=A0A836L7M2_9TRYP|nr:hypothetical protein JKF63_03237 [Porcisia hertigi]
MESDKVTPGGESHQKSLNPHTNSVCHCEHLKLKEPLQIGEVRELLKQVRASVPGLIEIHLGENMNICAGKPDATGGSTHALFSRHRNAHYLKIYYTHPARVNLMNKLMSKAERPAAVVDFVNIVSKL